MSNFEPIVVLDKVVTVPVDLFPEHLVGLHALIHWLEGYQSNSDRGRVPGAFELVMHYRSLRESVRRAKD